MRCRGIAPGVKNVRVLLRRLDGDFHESRVRCAVRAVNRETRSLETLGGDNDATGRARRKSLRDCAWSRRWSLRDCESRWSLRDCTWSRRCGRLHGELLVLAGMMSFRERDVERKMVFRNHEHGVEDGTSGRARRRSLRDRGVDDEPRYRVKLQRR